MEIREILVSHTKIILKSHERILVYATKCVINNPQKFLKKKQYSCNINSLAMSVSTEVSTF